MGNEGHEHVNWEQEKREKKAHHVFLFLFSERAREPFLFVCLFVFFLSIVQADSTIVNFR